IAEVANVPLERHPEIAERIRVMFESMGRQMSDNNLRQADVPAGATVIPQTQGTAPGLIVPLGEKVMYAVPGVPHEMEEMVARAVLPDLQARAGVSAVIMSRTLRTWGLAESSLAEIVGPRLVALDATGNPTIAFLASGIEGIKVRITAKASNESEAKALLAAEEEQLRSLLGDVVFGADDETMEAAVGRLLLDAGLTLGVAESVTGGLVGARITAVPGASEWFRGSIVSYDTNVKYRLLEVPEGPVVSEKAAIAMATGAARALGADVGLAVTGVAGPTEQEGQPVGTVWMGLALNGMGTATLVHLPGSRAQVRQFAAISLLDMLRRRLLKSF
ncbi:MAG TPA: nicotinamide-nucleotide amidohydrolase family protein, partial [Acidimicrobiales bacterium]